jgi:microcystin-dependent protein
MSDMHYIGEVSAFALSYVPAGWMPCDGQALAINQNQRLFAVIGERYGTAGTGTFRLPDLRGRSPIGAGQGTGLRRRTLGDSVGRGAVTLRPDQLPAHTHDVHQAPSGTPAATDGTPAYDAITASPADVRVAVTPLEPTGAGAPIELTPPSLVVGWFICVDGVFPR